MCACATRILAMASIQERDYFGAQHVRRWGDNLRVATNRERHLIEQMQQLTLELPVFKPKVLTIYNT